MTAGFLFGLLSKLFGYPFEVSAYGAAIAVFSAYSLQVWLYCRIPAQVATTNAQQLIARRWYLVATGITCAILAILPERSVDAAVIDRRLRSTSRNPRLSRGEAQVVAETLDLARKSRITIAPSITVLVRDPVRASALQEPVPPFTNAATALVNYVRSVPAPNTPSPAEMVMDLAAREALRAIHFNGRGMALIPVDESAAESAISAFTLAAKLSGSNSTLASDALLSRAFLREMLSQHDEALADVKAAENLGAADLSDIISTEGLALVNLGIEQRRPEDLINAIKLLKLKESLPPPSVIAGDPRLVRQDRLGLFDSLAMAHYALGQYVAAIQDSRQVIDLLLAMTDESDENLQVGLRISFLTIVGSYLHLSNVAAALDAASELERTSNGHPDVVALRRILETRPTDIQPILDNIEMVLRIKPLEGH